MTLHIFSLLFSLADMRQDAYAHKCMHARTRTRYFEQIIQFAWETFRRLN